MASNDDNANMDQLLRESGFAVILDAALGGDTDAQCYLGMVWRKGLRNVPISTLQASRWYSIAARNNQPDAIRILASLSKETNEPERRIVSDTAKKKSFLERRQDSSYTIHEKRYKILGGLLPTRGSVGSDFEYRIDGTHLRRIGYDGKKTKYQTDGNLQVFFRKPGASANYVFFAKFIDYYDKF